MKYKARVKKGRGYGRKLGFPTLNLEVPRRFTYPHGVYAGRIGIKSRKYPAAFHWGPVPVFGETSPSLEAHVIGTTLRSAPQEVTFELKRFLRKIKKFRDKKSLSTAIARDVAASHRV